MLNGASVSPNHCFISALTQPILGLSTKIHAIAVSSPGMANESSASEWNSGPSGASVRSTTNATIPPSSSVTTAVPAAKISELPNSRTMCQLE